MRAIRVPSARRISAGPSISTTSATADNGIEVVPAWVTVRFSSARAEARNFSAARIRMSTVRSERVMSVATSPWTIDRRTDATSETLSP